MSFENWLNYLRSAEKNSMTNGKVRKVFYKFPDGKQMTEEYSIGTQVLQRRAWRRTHKLLMDEPDWETELGDTPRQSGTRNRSDTSYVDLRKFKAEESKTEPILKKLITKTNIEWRIRNLPYPIDEYTVQATPGKPIITVRTTNQEYCKVIEMPELVRCTLNAYQENISLQHQNNTLIISYRKPDILCEMEEQVKLLLQEVETELDIDDLLAHK